MIPIRDNVRSRSTPVMVVLIILANGFVFFQELQLGRHLEKFMHAWALIPAEFVYWRQLGGAPLDPWRFIPIFTSMFVHGGWAHILGNMLFLWVFGDNVEDLLGHFRFVLFYLLCGFAAAMAQIVIDPSSTLPVVGASGAIAGVLGAYFLAYPRAKVLTLIPIFFWPWFVEIPALVFLGVWFLLQLVSGTLSLGMETSAGGGVAIWAHIGGFVCGMFLSAWMRKPPRSRLVSHGW